MIDDPQLGEVLRLLLTLHEKVDALGMRFRPNPAYLVREIAEATGTRSFTCRELCEHAKLLPKLADAIRAQCGTLSPRKLGHALSRVEGKMFDGHRILRDGDGNTGVIRHCEFSEKHTLPIARKSKR